MPDKWDQYASQPAQSGDKWAQYAAAPTPPHDSFLDKAGHLAEDVLYPTAGAIAGVAMGGAGGAETGPGAIGTAVLGGGLGAGIGNEIKRGMRSMRGRDDLNPQGWGQVSDDANSAAGGVMQELPAAMRAGTGVISKALPQIMQDAQNMGIKLSPGTTGGRTLAWIENHLRSNPSTSGLVNQTIDKETNQSVLNAGHQLADHIAQASLGKDPQILGNTIADTGASIQKAASDMYDHAVDSIGKKGAANLPIRLDVNVQSTAQKMLADLTANRGDFADAFKDAQDRQLAIHTLQEFANPTKTIVTPASKILGPDGLPAVGASSQQQEKLLPWDGARQMVSDIGALLRKGDTTLGKGALTQLKTALQTSMQQSLNEVNPGLGTQFRNASANYAKVQDSMSNSVVSRLMENKSPESAAKFLLANGSAISNTQALTQALTASGVKGATMQDVSGSLLKEMLTQSTDKAGATLKTGQLLGKWNGLGETGQKVLFPNPTQRAAISQFMAVADRYALPVSSKTGGQAAAQSAGRATANGVALGTSAVLAGTGHIGFALPVLAGHAAYHIGPQMALKMLQNPEGAQALAKAVSLPVGSAPQKVAIQTVLQLSHHLSQDISQ